MSYKGGKKKAIKNNKKVSKDKKTIKLKLNNGVEIPAKNIYTKDSEDFNINDIKIDKMRVSDKKLYKKEHDSYKYFYEDGNVYIHLKMTLIDVLGYYSVFKGDSKYDCKIMNFKLDDNSLEKFIDIFDHIGEISNIDLDNCMYEDKKGDTYLKTKVFDEACYRKDKDKTTNTTPNEKTKYNCRVLLQIQSVYCRNSDKDIIYYPQVFLRRCRYTFIANNKLIHEVLDFTDTEQESESEEEFNEDTK